MFLYYIHKVNVEMLGELIEPLVETYPYRVLEITYAQQVQQS